MTQEDGIPEPPDPIEERIKDPTGAKAEAWKNTFDDMEAIAADRRSDGWEVLTVTAIHTDTVSIDMRDDDEFGLKMIIPDNHAEEFEPMYDPEAFTEYLSYGREIEGLMYAVLEFIDSDTGRSILVACRYDMRMAEGMIASARSEGVLYTHLRTIDGTKIGVFEHEEWRPLVSPPARSD
jgi:hypothetical protein